MPHVVFRADASVIIGSGHVMRCLTLAKQLSQNGATVSFVSRELPGHLCHLVEQNGFEVDRLPYRAKKRNQQENDPPHWHWLEENWEVDAQETRQALFARGGADWLIVDHYALDKCWETSLRSYVTHMLVIDDLADRSHDCDLLLDQNLYKHMEPRYDGLVPKQCKLLLGPQYALLRPEFIEARQKIRPRNGAIERVLLFFGGSDPTDETVKTLTALSQLDNKDVGLEIVVGSSNPNISEIEKFCARLPNTRLHRQINYMASLMIRSDLAIGAGGTTTWERCYLGLPSLTVITAQNQAETTTEVAQFGATKLLGYHHEVTAKQILEATEWALSCPKAMREMSQKALQLMNSNEGRQSCILKTILFEN